VTLSIVCCLTQPNVRVSGVVQDVVNDPGEQLRVVTGRMVHNVNAHRMKVEIMRVFIIASQSTHSVDAGHGSDGGVLRIGQIKTICTLLEPLLDSCALEALLMLKIKCPILVNVSIRFELFFQ
jgi:hypothetical protein